MAWLCAILLLSETVRSDDLPLDSKDLTTALEKFDLVPRNWTVVDLGIFG